MVSAVHAATRVLSLLLSVATARALEPSEVGLLGLAVVVVGVAAMVGDCIETACVVARSEATDAQYGFVAVVIRGVSAVVVGSLLLATSDVLGRWLTSDRGEADTFGALMVLLVWQLALTTVAAFPRVVLQRRLDLIYLSVVALAESAVHVGLSIAMLQLGFRMHGLIAALLVALTVSAILLWARIADRSRKSGPRTSRAPWAGAVRGSLKLLTSSFVGYLNGRVDNVLVSATLGPQSMAFYNLAWNASRLPFGFFRQVVDSVLVPTFSVNRGEPQLVERIVRKALDHAYVVLLPVSAWLMVSADSLVMTVFGGKWLPLVPCLRVMSITVLLWPATAVFSGLLVATEQAHRVAVATATQFVTLLVLVPVLAYHGGLLGAAFADAGSMLTVTVILYGVIRVRFPDLRLDVANATALPAGVASAAALIGWVAGAHVSHPAIRLLSETLALGSAYLGCLWVLDRRGRLPRLLMVVRGAIQTRRGPAAGERVEEASS